MRIKSTIICTLIALLIIITPLFITNYVINNVEKYPIVNKHFIKKINDKYYSDEQIGILDMFTGSFKTFILNNNTPVLLEKLYKNLDEESKEKLDIAFNAILHIPDTSSTTIINFFHFSLLIHFFFHFIHFGENEKWKNLKNLLLRTPLTLGANFLLFCCNFNLFLHHLHNPFLTTYSTIS